MPSRLQGPLYFFSLLSSLTVAAIGSYFLLSAPSSGYLIFGIPGPSSLSTSTTTTSLTAYISIVGVRDLTLAFTLFLFCMLRDRRAVGVVLAGGLFATIGDALVMREYSVDPFWWIGAHAVTGVPMVGLMIVLLAGSSGKEAKLKR